jgi:hypothetical protein
MKFAPFLSFLPLWDTVNAIGQSQIPISVPPQQSSSSRPNIVFILTDDQDLHLNSLDYTPLTKKHLLDRGTFFKRHFCTIALCCPSRVSLWTGKAAHNTVRQLVLYDKMQREGFADIHLECYRCKPAVWRISQVCGPRTEREFPTCVASRSWI